MPCQPPRAAPGRVNGQQEAVPDHGAERPDGLYVGQQSLVGVVMGGGACVALVPDARPRLRLRCVSRLPLCSSWLLSTLNRKLQRRKVSVVADTFEGKLAITSRKVPPTPDQAEIAGITVDPTAEEYQREPMLSMGGRGVTVPQPNGTLLTFLFWLWRRDCRSGRAEHPLHGPTSGYAATPTVPR